MMTRSKVFGLAILILLTLARTTIAYGQHRGVTVTIRLRHTNGTPAAGEQVSLLRSPENEPVPPDCTTDVKGQCSWFVRRGLYTLAFEGLSLDQLVALATAEGGLTGLGLTVGEEDITYGFVIANGNEVYNDLAPESPVPEPFIPELKAMMDPGTNEPEKDSLPSSETTPTFEQIPAWPAPPGQATPTSLSAALTNSNDGPGKSPTAGQNNGWPRFRVFLILGLGLVLGGAAFTWQQRRRQEDAAAKANLLARLHAVVKTEPADSGMNKE